MRNLIVFLVVLSLTLSCNNQVKNTHVDDIQDLVVDSTQVIDSLSTYFTRKKRVQIKDILADDKTGFCMYFEIVNGKARNPRLHLQYYGYNIYQFSVSGQKYTYKANHNKGTGENKVYWYDYEIRPNDVDLLNTLIKAENPRIIFSDGTSVLITDEILIGIRRTLDYYKALGGELPISIL